MALAPGARLGPYEIRSALGAGGMGEVYRATDTTLARDVAIKTLPDGFAHDPERVARFKREAQVLASLNHPHIAAIYGLEQVNGGHVLVLELVEGDTLAQRLATGPVPINEALRLARQVADALQAAHEKGIVHRDLKPANIALTHAAQVKVLDFGLARVIEPEPLADTSASPTFSRAATQAGMILGTAAYMSPEQAKGRIADKRSDVWAFGAVLYELLTGRRAFDGDDVSDILAAVLKSEPDWTALPPNVPESIRTLVMRCLEKDRARRVADIAAALFVIDEQNALGPSGTIAARPSRTPRWKRALTATAAVVLGAVVASVAWWSVTPATPLQAVTRFTLALGAGQQFTNPGRQVLAISPDGTRVVYVANRRLYLRLMSEPEARPIVGSENETGVAHPVFSPDGQSVAFFSVADRTLKRLAVSGGAVVTICQADSPFGMSWGPDGIVFGQGPKGIMRVSPSGGAPEVLVSLNAGELAHGPQMLPGGQAVLFTLATSASTDRWDMAQIVVQSLPSGERKTLIDGGSDARYLPTGHLVYALGGTLFAVPLDVGRLEVTGGPTPVVEGVRRADYATGTAQFSASASGSLIFAPGPAGVSGSSRVFVVADRTGSADPLNLPPGAYVHPRVSPDGTHIAYGTDDAKEANIWIYELSGVVAPRRITFSGKNRYPVWSGDGQRVAFQSDRDGDLGIVWQRADGAGQAERLTRSEPGASHVPVSWSRDGKHLLFTIAQGPTVGLWTLALDDRKATAFGDVRSRSRIAAMFSPDGRWVAYDASSEGNTRTTGGVFVQPFPATGARYQIPRLEFDYHPLWSADGRHLFYIPAAGRFAAVSVQMQPTFAFGNPVESQATAFTQGIRFSDVRNYDITPAGTFVALVDPRERDVSATSAAPEIQVVLNWFEELKQRVPVK